MTLSNQESTLLDAQAVTQAAELLRVDGAGYVYWKGIEVEHFSRMEPEKAQEAREHLARKCLMLEANGMGVNARTTLLPVCYGAPLGTPWKLALLRYYCFMTDGMQTVGIFYCAKRDGRLNAFTVRVVGDNVEVRDYESGSAAFHACEAQGFASASCDANSSYEHLAGCFESLGISPARLDALLLQHSDPVH